MMVDCLCFCVEHLGTRKICESYDHAWIQWNGVQDLGNGDHKLGVPLDRMHGLVYGVYIPWGVEESCLGPVVV